MAFHHVVRIVLDVNFYTGKRLSNKRLKDVQALLVNSVFEHEGPKDQLLSNIQDIVKDSEDFQGCDVEAVNTGEFVSSTRI